MCNDLLRTQQTANLQHRALLSRWLPWQTPGCADKGFGVVDGLRVQDENRLRPGHRAFRCRFKGPTYGMPVAKPPRQFHTRVMDAVQRIAQQYAQAKTVLVVTRRRTRHGVAHRQGQQGLDRPAKRYSQHRA